MADALGRDFYDCDAEIEKQAGKTIPEIFKDQGEGYFRALEAAVLNSLLAEEDAIIAAGGGILGSDKAITIWLKAEEEVCFKRTQKTARPKLGDFQNFKALFKDRKPGYAHADFQIDNSSTTPHKALTEIMAVLRK